MSDACATYLARIKSEMNDLEPLIAEITRAYGRKGREVDLDKVKPYVLIYFDHDLTTFWHNVTTGYRELRDQWYQLALLDRQVSVARATDLPKSTGESEKKAPPTDNNENKENRENEEKKDNHAEEVKPNNTSA